MHCEYNENIIKPSVENECLRVMQTPPNDRDKNDRNNRDKIDIDWDKSQKHHILTKHTIYLSHIS